MSTKLSTVQHFFLSRASTAKKAMGSSVFPLYAIAVGCIMTLAGIMLPLTAFADSGQTTDKSVHYTALDFVGGYVMAQVLGTGLSGTLTSITYSYNGSTAFGLDMHVEEYADCTSGTLASAPIRSLTPNGGDFSSHGSQTDVTRTFSSPPTLNSSDCYVLGFEGNTGGNSVELWGSNTQTYNGHSGFLSVGTSFSGTTIGYQPSFTSLYFNLGGVSGTPPPPADQSTHIDTVTPYDKSINATSTTFTFGVTGYASTTDFVSSTKVTITYLWKQSSQLAISSPSLLEKVIDFPLYGAGSFSTTTTKDLSTANLGLYSMRTVIHHNRFNIFGFGFWDVEDFATSTTFDISTSTMSATFSSFDVVSGQATVFNGSNALAITTCDFPSFVSASSSVTSFVHCLFVPSSDDVVTIGKNLYSSVLSLFPIGYISRFVVIALDPTQVQPPALTYKFGSSSPVVLQASTASDPITFQAFDPAYWNGTSPLQQIKADDGTNKNIWDVIDPFVSLITILGVLFVILEDLMGFSMPQRQSESERMAKLDYGSMSDREFKRRVKITDDSSLTDAEWNMQKRNNLL